ncbi:MAG TPA: NAD(P)-dependent oxidoreductase [Nitrospirae bacterium]|nr:NAD(P)-dependent oxidoreductase [Nitrospirota bacterium]HDZ01774.1 NAD(P)-dependent oxidoreductase [Nitrospirota bacterium]
MGTIYVLQNCVKHNVRKIIFASSDDAIYGEQKVFACGNAS